MGASGGDGIRTTTHRPVGIPAGRPTEGKVTVSVSIKPLEDRIVVQAVEAEQTTASGLVIPDTAKEKPQEGCLLYTSPSPRD